MSSKQESERRYEKGRGLDKGKQKEEQQTEAMSYLLPIRVVTLVIVERATFRTRLGVAGLGILGLALVLLRLLSLRTVAGHSEPSATSTIESAAGSGLLDSTKATWRATLPNSDVLSGANPAHIFARTTV